MPEEPLTSVSTGPLLALELDRAEPLGLQLERRLRELIRSGVLRPEGALPSTRALAADLGVSRGVVVGAYAQLAAEGYIVLGRSVPPTVAPLAREDGDGAVEVDVPVASVPFVLRPDLPDLALFPRAQWNAASRTALQRAANSDLAYGEPFGAAVLRHRLAPFLARTRGVDARHDRTGVFAGSSHALFVLACALRADGARRIAVEDPGHRWRTRVLRSAGVEVVPVPVDAEGLSVAALPSDVAAVVVSPAHQFPTGVTLAPERRRALVDWAVSGDRLVVEHDYDGHFRYDRPPTGALQALAPEHVAYVGSASALLAPALRLGWAVVPSRLVIPMANTVFGSVVSSARLAQFALAELIANGQLDRQLRRARNAYRRRRELAQTVLGRALPGAIAGGAPTGLFIHIALPAGADEGALLAAARAGGIALDGVNEHAESTQPPGLVVGFAATPEPTLERALRALGRIARDL